MGLGEVGSKVAPAETHTILQNLLERQFPDKVELSVLFTDSFMYPAEATQKIICKFNYSDYLMQCRIFNMLMELCAEDTIRYMIAFVKDVDTSRLSVAALSTFTRLQIFLTDYTSKFLK